VSFQLTTAFVLTIGIMQVEIFCVVMLYSFAVGNQSFRGSYYLHLHGVTTQKISTGIFTAMKTSNLSIEFVCHHGNILTEEGFVNRNHHGKNYKDIFLVTA
jgi:hypothetical protein